MGLIRLLLALSVVIYHMTSIFGYSPLGGRMAVQSFFIISGFYMSLIIIEKYSFLSHSYRLFITNRFLRIYPIYWLVLLCTIIMLFLTSIAFLTPPQEPLVLTVIKNLLLFPTLDYLVYLPQFHDRLFVSLAWTLGLELQFYLVAPFIVKGNKKILLFLIFASLASRIYFTHPIRLYPDQLIDTFMTTEALFFLLGVVSYKIYAYIKNFQIKKPLLKIWLLCFVCITILYQYISPVLASINYYFPRTLEWSYYLTLTLSIPLLFINSGNNKLDRLLGDLSYPVYITHFLIINLFIFFGFSKSVDLNKLLIIATTLVIALLVNKYVSIPIEKYRQARTGNKIPVFDSPPG